MGGQKWMSARVLVPVIILAVLALAVAGCYSYANQVRNTAIQKEVALSAQYEADQNEMTTMVMAVTEAVGLEQTKATQLQGVLKAALEGRYGDKGFAGNGGFINAVHEAYPNIGDLNVMDQIIRDLQSRREAVKQTQNKRLDMVRDYDTWRKSGIVRSAMLNNFLPSENLKVQYGGETLVGTAALAHMSRVVKDTGTVEAFKTGTQTAQSYGTK